MQENWDINKTIRILEESDEVIVPTDKTNSFINMDTEKYMTMVNENLRCSSREIERDKVRECFEKVEELLDEVGFQLSKKVKLDTLTNHSKQNQFQHQSY